MSDDYTTTDSPSIYYFDYGAHTLTIDFQTDLDTVCESDASLPTGGKKYKVRSTAAAHIEGFRLAFSAVSRDGPRLGLLNLVPKLEPRPYTLDAAASPVQSAMKQAEELELRLATVNPDARVYGVLHELPSECLETVLEMVGREGSFTVYNAAVPCTRIAAGESKSVPALVCVALDMEVLGHRYHVPEAFAAAWQPMPPVRLHAASMAADTRRCGSGRWPYMHWCNCITSSRLRPSEDYLSSLRTMLEESPVAASLPTSSGIETVRDLLCVYYALAPVAADAEGEKPLSIVTRDVSAEASEQRTWYLAYGSNLSWEQVCLRIGPPYQRRPVKLHDYELVANKTPYSKQYASFGYYNVEPSEVRREKEEKGLTPVVKSPMPRCVCGAAYEIAEEQLELMDGYETGYYRRCLECEDLTEDASSRLFGLSCWTYIAEDTDENLLPSAEYLQRVLEGADILPEEYVAGIRGSPTNPMRSPRQDRRLRKEL